MDCEGKQHSPLIIRQHLFSFIWKLFQHVIAFSLIYFFYSKTSFKIQLFIFLYGMANHLPITNCFLCLYWKDRSSRSLTMNYNSIVFTIKQDQLTLVLWGIAGLLILWLLHCSGNVFSMKPSHSAFRVRF